MEEAQEFFLATLDDLRKRVSHRPQRKYDLACIGLLLRKLLMDTSDGSLVDKVKRGNEKIRYSMPVPSEKVRELHNWSAQGILGLFERANSSAEFGELLRGISDMFADLANRNFDVEVCELSREGLLKVIVDIHDHRTSTVEDLIDYAANVFGGAHFSPLPSNPKKNAHARLAKSKEVLSAP